MQNNDTKPKSLTEAIEKLEDVSKASAKDFKNILEKDYVELKKHLEGLKPYLTDLQTNLEVEVVKRKNQAEHTLKENPWMVIGIVGFFSFILGLFFAGAKSRDEKQK